MTPKPPAVLPGRPTIKMIATLARVAPSTVSRAINDDPSISLRTRARIQGIAARVGFVPNVTARGLVTRRSDVVALVLGPSQNPFYLEMIPLITERLALRSKPLMIVRMRESDRIEATLATLARHQVSGCLIGAASMTPEAFALCRRFDIPTVMVNRLANVEGSFVSCNNHEAGLQVASLFAAEGRRRIAYVGADPSKATFQDEQREAGLRDGAMDAGLTAPRRFATVYSYEGGLAAARALLGSPEILIADEPTSALDHDSREDFLQLVMAECAKRGTTLLCVSPDTSLGALVDRVISLDELQRSAAEAA